MITYSKQSYGGVRRHHLQRLSHSDHNYLHILHSFPTNLILDQDYLIVNLVQSYIIELRAILEPP